MWFPAIVACWRAPMKGGCVTLGRRSCGRKTWLAGAGQRKSRARSISSSTPPGETSRTSSNPSCAIRFNRCRASSGGQISETCATCASSAELGAAGKIDGDVRQHRVVAAGLAIDAHACLKVIPAAVPARGSPALALLRGVGDPARTAPGTKQDRRPSFATRPGRQCPAAVGGLAAPGVPHDVERGPHGPEPLVVVKAKQIEICARRTAADAEAEAVPRQRLHRLHAMRQFDRMT